MPDTTRSNPDLDTVSAWPLRITVSSSSKSGDVSASMTVSAGLPHTLTAFRVPGTTVGATLILTAVQTPWELALASLSGAHTNTCTALVCTSASTSCSNPGAWMPSSLVTSTLGLHGHVSFPFSSDPNPSACCVGDPWTPASSVGAWYRDGSMSPRHQRNRSSNSHVCGLLSHVFDDDGGGGLSTSNTIHRVHFIDVIGTNATMESRSWASQIETIEHTKQENLSSPHTRFHPSEPSWKDIGTCRMVIDNNRS